MIRPPSLALQAYETTAALAHYLRGNLCANPGVCLPFQVDIVATEQQISPPIG